jgi:alcohol dehydrogenase
MENGGGLSELFVAEASGCTRIPEALSFLSAAPLFCAGHVAVSAFHAALPRGAIVRVGVLGTGGIGRYVAQLTKAVGCPTTLVTSRRFKEGELATAGGPVATVPLDAILPRSFDVVVATSSDTSTLHAATEWLEPGGRLVIVALGPRCEIDPSLLVANELTLTGVTQGAHAHLVEALSRAADGVLQAEVEEFPFSLVQRALERLVARRVTGRAVVTFS